MHHERGRDLLDDPAAGGHPDHLLGRVTATFWTIQRALSPIGAAALTAATAQVGVTQVLLWTGITCVVIGLGGAFTPIRLARPELIAPSA